MDWQPIETYDLLPRLARPTYAAFFFEGTAPARGQHGKYGLPPMVELTRSYGSRVCTHWAPIPEPPNV